MPNDVEELIEKLGEKLIPSSGWSAPDDELHNTAISNCIDAIRQYFNTPEGKGWQPIATVPEIHGKRFIAYNADIGEFAAEWFDAGLGCAGFVYSWNQEPCTPTHWMPLPAPPGQEQQPPVGKNPSLAEGYYLPKGHPDHPFSEPDKILGMTVAEIARMKAMVENACGVADYPAWWHQVFNAGVKEGLRTRAEPEGNSLPTVKVEKYKPKTKEEFSAMLMEEYGYKKKLADLIAGDVAGYGAFESAVPEGKEG